MVKNKTIASYKNFEAQSQYFDLVSDSDIDVLYTNFRIGSTSDRVKEILNQSLYPEVVEFITLLYTG